MARAATATASGRGRGRLPVAIVGVIAYLIVVASGEVVAHAYVRSMLFEPRWHIQALFRVLAAQVLFTSTAILLPALILTRIVVKSRMAHKDDAGGKTSAANLIDGDTLASGLRPQMARGIAIGYFTVIPALAAAVEWRGLRNDGENLQSAERFFAVSPQTKDLFVVPRPWPGRHLSAVIDREGSASVK